LGAAADMTLRDALIARIRAAGPMPVAEYMAECLLNPRFGYYATRDPFGAKGDFTTAPEISQMFGELVGLALAQAWLDQGAPTPFTLAELGPGRGTLMADALRATRTVPGFHAAMQVWLVEVSPVLRRAQAAALAGFEPHWADTIADLPERPLLVVANEFFDALPIRQYIRSGDGWSERLVGLNDRGALTFGLGAPAPVEALTHRTSDTHEGNMVETCAPARAIMDEIAAHIGNHAGAVLVVDYGDWRSNGDTFQALAKHAYCDPLADPGQADLTAHVDFEALALAAHPLRPAKLTSQGVFLERLGITERARALAARLSGDALEAHILAHERLTRPEKMGTLFKVLGLTPKGAPPIAGTEHDA